MASLIRYTNAPIQAIYLGLNRIGHQGAIALADAISHCGAPIQQISFHHNSIGDQGAIALASMIRQCVAPIQTIDLEGNKIGDEGATAIEDSLRYNNTVTLIDLRHNNVSKSIRDTINKLCEDTPERKAAVAAHRQKYPIMVDLVDDTEDEEDEDVEDIYLSVEI